MIPITHKRISYESELPRASLESRRLGRGFTLIETLVAIAIVALAVVGPLYTADRAAVAAQLSNEELTASYLAQEGIEYVRALRDNAYLSTYNAYRNTPGANIPAIAWNAFLNTNPVSSCRTGTCSYDPIAGQLSVCTGSCQELYLADGYYTTESGLANAAWTPYTRSIQVQNITPAPPTDAQGNPVDVQAVSTVTWDFHGTPHTVSIAEDLTPWQ